MPAPAPESEPAIVSAFRIDFIGAHSSKGRSMLRVSSRAPTASRLRLAACAWRPWLIGLGQVENCPWNSFQSPTFCSHSLAEAAA